MTPDLRTSVSRIVECDHSHRDAWNTFVRRTPKASFYHLFEWRDVNGRCFGHRSCYLAAFDGPQVVGIFPIVHLKTRLFGNIACSLPFVNYGGPCSEDPHVEAALLQQGARLARDWRVDYLEIRSRAYLGADLPAAEHKVSMTLALDPDPDTLWNAFKSSHRQEIRRGYKNGFAARFGGAELLPDFYTVLAESWRDLGTPIYARQYLETILDTFPDSTRLCVVYDGKTPAAAAFDGIHGGTAEGMWLGMRSRYRKQMAGYVLYWELIKNACERGLSHFHLGRSTAQSGGETFKKKWNASARQLYWHYALPAGREIPQLNVANPRYQLAIRAWRRLPVAVTQLIGPLIARSIP
jgi:FemAB-related protein (PEP-CTERM system-associated)